MSQHGFHFLRLFLADSAGAAGWLLAYSACGVVCVGAKGCVQGVQLTDALGLCPDQLLRDLRNLCVCVELDIFLTKIKILECFAGFP